MGQVNYLTNSNFDHA